MNNYKIKVNSEAESKEAQELFFELGYKWHGAEKKISYLNFISSGEFTHLLAWSAGCFKNVIQMGCGSEDAQELTIHQLHDLVVLHRNDVSDANYTCSEKPIQPEQGLISGKDALIALANGKEVEYFNDGWIGCDSRELVVAWYLDDVYQFRLKPCTITLNIEIPAPFEPKVGDTAYFLSTSNSCGYTYTDEFKGYGFDSLIQFGAWRTEEEIKKVVAALRQIFGGA